MPDHAYDPLPSNVNSRVRYALEGAVPEKAPGRRRHVQEEDSEGLLRFLPHADKLIGSRKARYKVCSSPASPPAENRFGHRQGGALLVGSYLPVPRFSHNSIIEWMKIDDEEDDGDEFPSLRSTPEEIASCHDGIDWLESVVAGFSVSSRFRNFRFQSLGRTREVFRRGNCERSIRTAFPTVPCRKPRHDYFMKLEKLGRARLPASLENLVRTVSCRHRTHL